MHQIEQSNKTKLNSSKIATKAQKKQGQKQRKKLSIFKKP